METLELKISNGTSLEGFDTGFISYLQRFTRLLECPYYIRLTVQKIVNTSYQILILNEY